MEELLEMITWCQLGIHDKPVSELTDRQITTRISNAFLSVRQTKAGGLFSQVGLLNVDGYYDPLLAFVDKAVHEGFVTPAERSIIVDAHTPHDLLDKLQVDDDDSSLAPDHIA